jgi:hypothetical protein
MSNAVTPLVRVTPIFTMLPLAWLSTISRFVAMSLSAARAAGSRREIADSRGEDRMQAIVDVVQIRRERHGCRVQRRLIAELDAGHIVLDGGRQRSMPTAFHEPWCWLRRRSPSA